MEEGHVKPDVPVQGQSRPRCTCSASKEMEKEMPEVEVVAGSSLKWGAGGRADAAGREAL